MSPDRFRYRILATAALLPTAIVCADQLALEIASKQSWQWPATVLVFAGFVMQTGVLGYAVGRWLPNWPWRLGVLMWGIVLTNVLLFRAAAESNLIWSASSAPVQLLCHAFLSAECSAAIVWLMVGARPLGERLLLVVSLSSPAAIMVSLFMSHRIGRRADFWFAVMLVQLIATVGLTAFIRMFRWRIEYLDPDARGEAGSSLQFSIRHMLIATTAAAIVTAVGKAVVTHSAAIAHSASYMGWTEWLQVAIDASLLSTLSLVAVWAALGRGGTALRLTMLLILSAILAGLLWWAETTTEARLPPGASSEWWFRQTLARQWWMGWTLLAGTFLASWLSVLRVTGYRLVRHRGPA